MTAEILYQQSAALVAAVLIGLMLLGAELGYRLGRRGRATNTDLTRIQIISIQGSTMALLALLLGFTFSMALSRFEYRKQMVVMESNAIGTAALRAQFLPESHADEIDTLVCRYVEIRLESVLSTCQGSPERDQLDVEDQKIQLRLWRIANEAAEADPQSVPLGLFVHAVNELIDVKMQRDVAVANHVPESVLVFLLAFSVVAAVVLGYGNGLAGARIVGLTGAYGFIVVLVVMLIIDLDHPQQGLARTSQDSMLQLEKMLETLRP